MKTIKMSASIIILAVCCSLINQGQQTDSCDLMIQASEKGQIEIIRLLINQGINTNCRGLHQYTPLLAAAKHNHIDIVKLLCRNNADINARSEFLDPDEAFTPLLWAIVNDNALMAEFLLDNGADPNLSDGWGNTPLKHAATIGSLPLVKLLVAKGANIGYRRNPGGRSAIFDAMLRANLPMVEFLIQNGEDPKIKDSNGMDLLMVASNTANIDGVKYLIEKGVNLHNRTRFGTTAMHLAAGHDSAAGLSVLSYLIGMGGDISARDERGETPLMVAANHGAVGAARILLEKGASVNEKNEEGLAPMHFAARGVRLEKKNEIVSLLLARGAYVNAADNEGCTPLMVASKYPEVQLIELLINHGAQIDAQDQDGWTALMYAAYWNRVGVIKVLINRGADTHIKTSTGKTALSIAEDTTRSREAHELLKRLIYRDSPGQQASNPTDRNKSTKKRK
jgi:ankyrin repeat protein